MAQLYYRNPNQPRPLKKKKRPSKLLIVMATLNLLQFILLIVNWRH